MNEESEPSAAPPPLAWERSLEVIRDRKKITLKQLRVIAKKEHWHFGIGQDLLGIILADRDLGRIELKLAPHRVTLVARHLTPIHTAGPR